MNKLNKKIKKNKVVSSKKLKLKYKLLNSLILNQNQRDLICLINFLKPVTSPYSNKKISLNNNLKNLYNNISRNIQIVLMIKNSLNHKHLKNKSKIIKMMMMDLKKNNQISQGMMVHIFTLIKICLFFMTLDICFISLYLKNQCS